MSPVRIREVAQQNQGRCNDTHLPWFFLERCFLQWTHAQMQTVQPRINETASIRILLEQMSDGEKIPSIYFRMEKRKTDRKHRHTYGKHIRSHQKISPSEIPTVLFVRLGQNTFPFRKSSSWDWSHWRKLPEQQRIEPSHALSKLPLAYWYIQELQ